MKNNMSKPRKTKAQSQRTVSKAAKDLGFKNIKEAKSFLKTPENPSKASNPEAVGPEAVGFTDYQEINEEISKLMLDPHATDEYIVERAKYLISKYKGKTTTNKTETCCENTAKTFCCAPQPPKEAVEQVVKFLLIPKTRYYNLFDNFTVTTSL
jgi:hypothetical protein